ncbi:MAG: hypothetical protein AABZ32_00690 [Bacteroidota bacterium]
MAKKWSQKTEKATLHPDDEFLILDSEDANAATKNKRVKVKNAMPCKKYVALLTQIGTNAPTAIVLENTIGNIVWARAGTGQYTATLTGAFTINKTYAVIYNNDFSAVNVNNLKVNLVVAGADGLNLYTVFSGALADGRLSNNPIEIRVYM